MKDPIKEIYGKSAKDQNVEKYIQWVWVTKLSLTNRTVEVALKLRFLVS